MRGGRIGQSKVRRQKQKDRGHRMSPPRGTAQVLGSPQQRLPRGHPGGSIPSRGTRTSMEFLPGCSAASSWSPSLCSLLILSSLASRFRLMKFCIGRRGEGSALAGSPVPLPGPLPGPSTHLILAPAAGVVQIAVTPVVLHAVVCLLVQPVQLVGAALHVVLQ